MLIPFGVVTTQCDIQRQNIFYFIGMYGLITNRRASRRKAMQKRLAAFFWGTGKEVAFSGFEIFAEPVAILLGDVVNIAVHIFTSDRQVLEFCQNMTADFRQHFRLIGTDVKDLLIFFGFEGVQTHGENR